MVILLNCVTLGMYQPCENIDCTSDRCQILQVRQTCVCVCVCVCVNNMSSHWGKKKQNKTSNYKETHSFSCQRSSSCDANTLQIEFSPPGMFIFSPTGWGGNWEWVCINKVLQSWLGILSPEERRNNGWNCSCGCSQTPQVTKFHQQV